MPAINAKPLTITCGCNHVLQIPRRERIKRNCPSCGSRYMVIGGKAQLTLGRSEARVRLEAEEPRP